MGRRLEQAIAVLNGAVGDYLVERGNGLATRTTLVHGGVPFEVSRAKLCELHPAATGRVVILVHGLMSEESVFRMPDGGDYGSLLAEDLGFTPLYVRYNSGLRIGENGRLLCELLSQLVAAYPCEIEELVLLGHSMGGLVIRSACHAASLGEHAWLRKVRRAIYAGTPHRGAPLERGGRVVSKLLSSIPDPYTQLAAELAELRSRGVKDLGDAKIDLSDAHHPLPLLPGIEHLLIAATVSVEPWVARLFGDAIVPITSATDGLTLGGPPRLLAPTNVKFLPGMSHLALAHHPHVYRLIHAFLEQST